jgi:hypothetical protein
MVYLTNKSVSWPLQHHVAGLENHEMKIKGKIKICGFNGSDHEEWHLLGCNAMWFL